MPRSCVAAILLIVLAAACSPVTVNGPSVQAIRSKGELVVAVRSSLTGFGVADPKTHDVTGLDADLARAIAGELGVKTRFVQPADSERVSGLEADQFDLVVSAMTITESRKERIDFSLPYYTAGQSLLVKTDSPIRYVADLDGKKVCSARGSTSAKTIQQKAPKAKLVPVSRYADAAKQLMAGGCDAVSTDDVLLFGLVATTPGTELRGDPITNEPLGIGIKKGRKDLVEFVNAVLVRMKGDGRLKQLYDRHLKPLAKRDITIPF
jgi:ABC-type amino acid transport substrate-binding protein